MAPPFLNTRRRRFPLIIVVGVISLLLLSDREVLSTPMANLSHKTPSNVEVTVDVFLHSNAASKHHVKTGIEDRIFLQMPHSKSSSGSDTTDDTTSEKVTPTEYLTRLRGVAHLTVDKETTAHPSVQIATNLPDSFLQNSLPLYVIPQSTWKMLLQQISNIEMTPESAHQDNSHVINEPENLPPKNGAPQRRESKGKNPDEAISLPGYKVNVQQASDAQGGSYYPLIVIVNEVLTPSSQEQKAPLQPTAVEATHVNQQESVKPYQDTSMPFTENTSPVAKSNKKSKFFVEAPQITPHRKDKSHRESATRTAFRKRKRQRNTVAPKDHFSFGPSIPSDFDPSNY